MGLSYPLNSQPKIDKNVIVTLSLAIYAEEFTTYSAGGFSWEDQVRTAKFLAAHHGPVVISNQATPRIIELYKGYGFQLSYLDAPRRISCTGDRTAAREVLAIKP